MFMRFPYLSMFLLYNVMVYYNKLIKDYILRISRRAKWTNWIKMETTYEYIQKNTCIHCGKTGLLFTEVYLFGLRLSVRLIIPKI